MNLRTLSLIAVAYTAWLCAAPNLHAAAGDLDLSFSAGVAEDNDIYAAAVQSDGKVIIGGRFTSVNGVARHRIARLNADGSLDTTFNSGSGVAGNRVSVIVLQSDGKIIIGGTFQSVNTFPYNNIARLNPNGTVDTSFIPTDGSFDPDRGFNTAVSTIALQPDGKMVVGGQFTSFQKVPRNRIARLNADGSLDTTFAPTGPGNDASTPTVSALRFVPGGKLMIGGSFTSYDGVARNCVARLNSNGSLDTTFNPGSGIGGIGVGVIALQPNGKILLGGKFTSYNNSAAPNLVRVNADGTRDTTFSADINPDSFRVNAVTLQLDGKILVGGTFTTGSGASLRKNVCRLQTNGARDDSFVTGDGAAGAVLEVALAPNDKIIIAGEFNHYDTVKRDGVARLFGIGPALRNISTRAAVGTGDRVVIAGFIITGGTKELLLRGIGPSLAAQGVPGTLQDPVLELYNSSGGLINSNNNWRDTQQNAILETTIAPADNRESALLATLGASSYTVVLRGAGDTTGNGLIELYDLSGGTASKLANISTRSFVGTGDSVLIGGFIIEGTNARTVVRAIGPSLAPAGVADALADPRVALYNGSGDLVGFNRDWQDGQGAEISATGLQPSDNREAALIVTLQAGNYTAIIEGESNATGVGLVEVYHVQQ